VTPVNESSIVASGAELNGHMANIKLDICYVRHELMGQPLNCSHLLAVGRQMKCAMADC